MRRKIIFIFALASAITLSDGISQTLRRRAVVRPPSPNRITIADDFRNGSLGWEAGFADYSPASEGMELEGGIAPLPPELGIDGTGFRIHGNNHSDDLFSFITKKLTVADGIRRNQRYFIDFRIVMASNAGETCGGVGGAPGLSVYVKAGASTEKPRVELDALNHYRVVNIDKGNQAMGGPNMTLAGTVSNGTDRCSEDAPFVTIQRVHRHPFAVVSNDAGELWLIVGTDSGFEGIQTLYYQSIEATLTQAPD